MSRSSLSLLDLLVIWCRYFKIFTYVNSCPSNADDGNAIFESRFKHHAVNLFHVKCHHCYVLWC